MHRLILLYDNKCVFSGNGQHFDGPRDGSTDNGKDGARPFDNILGGAVDGNGGDSGSGGIGRSDTSKNGSGGIGGAPGSDKSGLIGRGNGGKNHIGDNDSNGIENGRGNVATDDVLGSGHRTFGGAHNRNSTHPRIRFFPNLFQVQCLILTYECNSYQKQKTCDNIPMAHATDQTVVRPA